MFMCTGIMGIPIKLDSKASAVDYAISKATYLDKNSKAGIDLVLASGIYDFIVKRVELPELPKEPIEELSPLVKVLAEKIKNIKTNSD